MNIPKYKHCKIPTRSGANRGAEMDTQQKQNSLSFRFIQDESGVAEEPIDFDDEPVRSARPPPPPLPPSALVQKPAPVVRPPPPKLPQERRGSMFDPSNKDINKMLAPPPWLSKTEESDGEGDDWDADSD